MKKINKKTAIIGATTNPSRYAHFAAERLKANGVEFIPLGIKKGTTVGEEIIDIRSTPHLEDIHTVTLYLGPQNQGEYIDYILSLSPKRIIFNPGTENIAFAKKAEEKGIEALEACTLVMLSAGTF